jgi:hypothetical protein
VQVTPPENSREMSLWLVKTGPSWRSYYDSRGDLNYRFRYLQIDPRSLNEQPECPAGRSAIS